MWDDEIYVVYRKHDDGPPEFYGWTKAKTVVKVYLSQRARDKYIAKKISLNDMANVYGESPEPDMMIDYVDLVSKSTGEKVKLFITKAELCEIEKRIQRYFRDLCRIIDANPKASIKTLSTFRLLDDYYMEALELIGFEPPEMEAMFDPLKSTEDTIDDEIEDAYLDQSSPGEFGMHSGEIVGLSHLTKLHTKILYSLEAFLKVMKNDM